MKYHRHIIQFCLVLLLTAANEVASAPSRQETNPTTSRPDPKLQEQSGGNSDRFFEAKTTREMDQVLGRQATPASLSFLPIVDRNGRIAYPNLQFLRILNEYQEEARQEMNREHWDEAFQRIIQLLKFAFALKETRTPEGMNSGEYNRSQAAGLFDLLRQKAPAPRVTEYRRQLEAFKQPDAALIAAVRRRKDPDPRWAEAMLYFAKEKIAEDDILLGPTNPKPPKAAPKSTMLFFRVLLYGALIVGGAVLFITLLSKAIESINLRAKSNLTISPSAAPPSGSPPHVWFSEPLAMGSTTTRAEVPAMAPSQLPSSRVSFES